MQKELQMQRPWGDTSNSQDFRAAEMQRAESSEVGGEIRKNWAHTMKGLISRSKDLGFYSPWDRSHLINHIFSWLILMGLLITLSTLHTFNSSKSLIRWAPSRSPFYRWVNSGAKSLSWLPRIQPRSLWLSIRLSSWATFPTAPAMLSLFRCYHKKKVTQWRERLRMRWCVSNSMNAKDCQPPPEPWRETWNRFSLRASKGTCAANTLILVFQPLEP